MKNTLENKAKFFAQYWEQEILCWCSDAESNQKGTVYEGNIPFKEDWLELTPLSQITDRDAIEVVGAIECLMRKNNPDSGYYGMSPSGIFVDSIQPDGGSYHLGIYQADYLRSKGYALPYMGLSVEKQIEYGWIKLNEI